ncbi:MAG: adenylate/guanylate cyclase domain-containing protein [Lachnospiraceae bacterium]|nr:adenylate/guanylate cyclase domain-containing protein [Lachnospiraceae bacterium]
MKIFQNERSRTLIISLLASLLLTLLIAAGKVLDRVDLWAQDSWFQSDKALDGEIIVIGIDDKSLEELGPYNTWDRTYMAAALEKLAEDPEMKPAVVAIDTLYIEESSPEADERLADAAAQLGNVVTASFATIGSKVITEGDNTYYATDAVLTYEEPYDALRDATTQGHINAMYDTDGILRHALLFVKPEGRTVYSMAYETARIYGEFNGFDIQMPPASSRGNYYVTYSAKPRGYYDGYSFSDLINGRIDPQQYAGKVVFIGPYAKGLQDEYFTTIERSKLMYGVEYQANVVQMILESNYKTEVGRLPQAIVLFILCFLLFLLFQKVGIKLSSVIAVAAIVFSIGIEYALFNVKIGGVGHVLHPLWLPVGILVFYVASIVIHYVKSTLEKRRVTRTFERYVAPEIVSEILKGGTEALSLGGKTVDIAVLFVDVRGFTTMSERLDPEKVVFILNRYLTMASGCVEATGGTLDKFVGDAMMAFWGAPLPQEDPVMNAVKTAMGIVEGCAKVSEELKAEIGEELRVGVGVNYGPAVVGNMGAEKHMDYTAIGDTVNTAARLEANAPGGKVYISRSVADALEGRITYTSLGDTIKLKGKAEGFEVLELNSITDK